LIDWSSKLSIGGGWSMVGEQQVPRKEEWGDRQQVVTNFIYKKNW